MDKRSVIRIIMLVIVFACFGYLAFYYFAISGSRDASDGLSKMKSNEIKVEYQTAPTEENVFLSYEDKMLPKYKSLYQKNKNLIGWIKIDDTSIDYPVMKSINGNGEFYLDHNYDGKEDRNGTLFMDDKCDPQGPSDNLIIYGHNMKSGLMFGELDSYKSEAFYNSHKKVKFDTLFSEGIYEVAFVFQSHVYEESEITFKYYQFIEPNSKEEFDSGINEMRSISLYDTGVDAQYGDQLITLSTCDYDENNGRFVVVCKRIN